MRSRLELKAQARRDRVRLKAARASLVDTRDPDKPLDDVPVLKIGRLRVRSLNRQIRDERGRVTRTPPRRTR